MTLEGLNGLTVERASDELRQCCGSNRWAGAMAAERPFASEDALLAIAERLWWSLDAADWLEAFAAHPRIGDRPTSAWSSDEQSAASGASADVKDRLAHGNRAYEQRFGYTFLVCATGRSAVEILDMLERRLPGPAAEELQIAAAEQRKITTLRLQKLLRP